MMSATRRRGSGEQDGALSITAKIAICAALGLAAADCLADVDGCKEMGNAESEKVLPQVIRSFRDSGVYPVERVDISPGRDCGDEIYFVFEAKLVYRSFGSNWIVSKDKKTGRVRIQKGI